MSLIRKHGAVLQAWACLDLVCSSRGTHKLGICVCPKPASCVRTNFASKGNNVTKLSTWRSARQASEYGYKFWGPFP